MENRKWLPFTSDHFRCWPFVILLLSLGVSFAHARGRRPPDDDVDRFPDYNRLEMHPKPKDPDPEAKPEAASHPRMPTASPVRDAPTGSPASDLDQSPKAPPAAQPLPPGASEPPMPDDLLNTLIPSATAQK